MSFRSDGDALNKYRSLHRWLQYFIESESLSHAEAIIEEKIEAYEWALAKHGFETSIGAIKSICNWDNLLTISAGGGIAAALGGKLIGALTAGSLRLARGSLELAKWYLEREDITRTKGAEIALIVEARKKFGDR